MLQGYVLETDKDLVFDREKREHSQSTRFSQRLRINDSLVVLFTDLRKAELDVAGPQQTSHRQDQQELGEVGAVTEVGGVESPTPCEEAPPLDFSI